MKAFESDGRFWLPEAPDNDLFGRLVWEKAGGTELTTNGSLQDERGDLGDKFPVIHGVVENTPHSLGRDITLWNSWLVGRTTSATGLIRDRYRVQVALSGRHLGDEKTVAFKSAELRFSSLGAWTEGFTGLVPLDRIKDRKFTFGSKYETPDPLVIPCSGATLKIHTTATSKQRRRRYAIEESVVMEVVPDHLMRLSELNGAFVYPLQNFFTFAMNCPASVERWVNHLPDEDDEEGNSQVDVSYPRYFSGPENRDEEPHYQPLFYLKHVKERLPFIFGAWLAAADRLSDTFNLYFGVQYSNRMFLDWRFQTILHALTLYGRVDGVPAINDNRLRGILDKVGPDDAEYLTKLLDTSLLLNDETVLLQLLEEHGSEIEWLFGRSSRAFVDRVLNTFQYLLRRKVHDKFAASQGTDLYYLTETLGWLMKLCLLKEIGFPKDERRMLLERNQEAQHISVNAKKAVPE